MNFKPQTIELTDQERRERVVNILTDSIILERIYYLMEAMNQVGSFNKESNWHASDHISSYINAFPFMGLSSSLRDEELGDKLGDVFHNTYKEEMKTGFTKDANIVAEHIYTEWLDITVKHNREQFLNDNRKAS